MDNNFKYINDIKDIENDRYIVTIDGKIIDMKSGKELCKYISNRGYYYVDINNKTLYIHRLVGMLYVLGHSKEKDTIKFKNGNKLDTRAENLEWCTLRDKLAYDIENDYSVRPSGEKHFNASLTNDDVDKICQLLIEHNGDVNKVLIICNENRIHVSEQMIRQIKFKRSWKKISDKWFDSNKFHVKHFSTDDIREICKSLKKNNFNINDTLRDLNDIIEGLSYSRVRSILYKQSHVRISDEYFTLNDVYDTIDK